MILDLLLINIIMVLIHESGFIDKLDEAVSKKWKFHHLPYPVRCMLCGTWWLSLLYILIVPGFSLLGVALALMNAHLTEVTQGIWRVLKSAVLRFLGILNDFLQ